MHLRLAVLGALFVVACGEEPLPPPAALPAPPPTASVAPPEAPAVVPPSVATLGTGALLFDDLGTHHRAVTASRPRNGWALFGLSKALEAQHKGREAKAAKAEFDAAWAKADVKLTASAF
jgi:hypothetical protein